VSYAVNTGEVAEPYLNSAVKRSSDRRDDALAVKLHRGTDYVHIEILPQLVSSGAVLGDSAP
jgi:hypothetical protein